MTAVSANVKTGWISEEEYLRRELASEAKHEYIDGYFYAMSGASRNHQRISGNLFAAAVNHLRGSQCEAFTADFKVKAGNHFFYPDVLVACGETGGEEYYTKAPILVVEVLSKSTRRRDETTKRVAYQSLSTLIEYVLIEQDIVDVEVCRRREGWVSNHFFMGDEVTFESIGLTLTVEDIYERVENEDVKQYLEEKGQASDAVPSEPGATR